MANALKYAGSLGVPIIHVNGDDPEAVVYAAKVATELLAASKGVAPTIEPK